MTQLPIDTTIGLELPAMLQDRMEQPLPAVSPVKHDLCRQFEPPPHDGRHYASPKASTRRAAVLVLLYPQPWAGSSGVGEKVRWFVPLTVRSQDLTHHPGQVSLPGGRLEPGETAFQGAVREFHEELGAEDVKITPIGPMTPVVTGASNYHVRPYLAVADRRPRQWEPNPCEVEQVLEVPLDVLFDGDHFVEARLPETSSRAGETPRSGDPLRAVSPYFHWRKFQVWGVTCMILGELMSIVTGKL